SISPPAGTGSGLQPARANMTKSPDARQAISFHRGCNINSPGGVIEFNCKLHRRDALRMAASIRTVVHRVAGMYMAVLSRQRLQGARPRSPFDGPAARARS